MTACEFTGVGTVKFIAPDPSDEDDYRDPDGIEPEWVVVANLLFLSCVAAYSGWSSSMIIRAGQREPEVVELMRAVGDAALRQAVLRDALTPVWPHVETAARKRGERRATSSRLNVRTFPDRKG
jgi:hypothetical protein